MAIVIASARETFRGIDGGFVMTCDEARRNSLLADDGEAIPAEAARHLESCPTCRAAVEAARRIVAAYRALDEEVPGDALRARILRAAKGPATRRWPRRLALMGAAAAILAAAAWWARERPAAPAGGEPGSAAADPLAFETPRQAIESRMSDLEWNLSPSLQGGDSLGIGDLRRRIEAIEQAIEAATPARKDPGQGAVPGSTGGARGRLV
jgi:hypothetical protein